MKIIWIGSTFTNRSVVNAPVVTEEGQTNYSRMSGGSKAKTKLTINDQDSECDVVATDDALEGRKFIYLGAYTY